MALLYLFWLTVFLGFTRSGGRRGLWSNEDLYYATLVVASLGHSGDGTPSPSGRRLGLLPGTVGHVRRRRQEFQPTCEQRLHH
jgi:hypothetical protein